MRNRDFQKTTPSRDTDETAKQTKLKYRKTEVTVSNNFIKKNDDVGTGIFKVCNILKNGLCEKHQELASRLQVTRKVWKDHSGGRGYGYVSKNIYKAGL